MKSILSAVVGATLALSAIEAGAQATPGERQVSLTIESDTLAAALDKWAQQSGFQIFVQDWEATKNLPARTLKGTFAAQDALEQLLSGTTLTYVWISDKAVSIRKKTAQTVPTALQRTSLEGQQEVQVEKFSGDGAGSGAASYAAAESSREGVAAQGAPRTEEVEEIVVTGTHISGVNPAGAAVNVYTRKNIEQSGATTLEQFARTMTENFSNIDSLSNPNSNANLAATGATANFFMGADFNLHGLGPGTTLTLLNGRRVAAAGASGDFVDVSMIPLGAIERIEVVSDGSSAIYGSDAVSGVVNIITDNDFSGAQTRLQYGGASDGGAESFSASQLLGTTWDSGNVMANLDYNWSGGLDASRRDYIPDLGGPNAILPKNRRASVLVSGSQSFTDATRLFATAIYSERDFSLNQTRESLILNSSVHQEGDAALTDVTLGMEHHFSGDRRVNASAGRSKLRQTNEVLSDYSIGLRFFDTNDNETLVDTVDAVADGTLISWAGGAIKGALGGGYRSEEFAQDATSNGISVATVNADRHVTSAFAELFVPIVGEANAVTLVRRLEISAAVRYDDYSDFGSAVNPKFGIVWSPASGLDLRSTYGTSFRAPLLLQLNQPVSSSTIFFPNPGSPLGFTDTLLVGGGNQALTAEEARTLTAGFAVQPQSLPSLKMSIDYFDIRYRDRIQSPPFDFGTAFTDPGVIPFLDLQPSSAQVQGYFDSPNFRGDSAGLGPAGVEAILDSRYHNISVTEQSGLTLRGSYAFASRDSEFLFDVSVDRLLDNKYQVTATTPVVSIVDAFAQPTKWKGRAALTWSSGAFTTVLAMNRVSKYDNTLFTPSQSIDSWTTGDLYLAYDMGDRPEGFLRNMTAALSIVNLTNEEPPRVQIPADRLLPGQAFIPFDSANSSPLGRLISLTVGKRW